ncbi:MAG TPA: DUF5996 family protein [Candidatus Acidoferrum sp.]|nr:DUF5996 family protein [Candidatus Acidoferrum sp.]
MAQKPPSEEQAWPALPLEEWQDTCATLHMWTQIVGKVRLALSPHVNHWWEVPLYVTARGLTTLPIPYQSRAFEVQFDFISHKLEILTGGGGGGDTAAGSAHRGGVLRAVHGLTRFLRHRSEDLAHAGRGAPSYPF